MAATLRPFCRGRRLRGVESLDWPCGQNPGRKPEGRQRASTHEAMSVGEQSSTCRASTFGPASRAESVAGVARLSAVTPRGPHSRGSRSHSGRVSQARRFHDLGKGALEPAGHRRRARGSGYAAGSAASSRTFGHGSGASRPQPGARRRIKYVSSSAPGGSDRGVRPSRRDERLAAAPSGELVSDLKRLDRRALNRPRRRLPGGARVSPLVAVLQHHGRDRRRSVGSEVVSTCLLTQTPRPPSEPPY
jgi:hypothetical protein